MGADLAARELKGKETLEGIHLNQLPQQRQPGLRFQAPPGLHPLRNPALLLPARSTLNHLAFDGCKCAGDCCGVSPDRSDHWAPTGNSA